IIVLAQATNLPATNLCIEQGHCLDQESVGNLCLSMGLSTPIIVSMEAIRFLGLGYVLSFTNLLKRL
ncbi:MAG TPA: hypothetical protein VE955_09435, partial [Candidatus Dormibacteraeota bacterium]|nr:hypothetical protein [Candidatus Dormibacteraeota bacterium]